MTKFIVKYANRYLKNFFIFLTATLISGWLYKVQKYRFSIVLVFLSLLVFLILFPPLIATRIFLFVAETLPFSIGVRLGGLSVNFLELTSFMSILVWISLFLWPEDKKRFKLRFGFLECFLLAFFLVFIISVIQGILAGYSIGDKATFFKTDTFRSVIYYSTFLVFLKILQYYSNSESVLIKDWFVFSALGVILYLLLSFFRYKRGYAFTYWGFNFQVFSFLWGFIFTLWLLTRRRFYFVLMLFYGFVVFFVASRTIFMGMILMYIFIMFFWILFIEENPLKFILKTLAVSGALLLIIYIYIAFLQQNTESLRLVKAVYRMRDLLNIKYIKYFPSIQARIIESYSCIVSWQNSNRWTGTPFGALISTYAGGNIVDVFYATLIAKMGLIGLFSFLGMMFSFWVRSIRILRKIKDIKDIFLKSAVITSTALVPTALIMAITMNHLWFASGTIVTIALFMALISSLWYRMKEKIPLSNL